MKGNKRATNTIELNRYAFDNLLSVLGDKNLREISQRDIEKWKKKALESLVDTSVNIYQRSLITAFSVAVRWGYLKTSPFEGVQLIHAESEKEKPKVYTQEQLQKLYGVVRKDNLFWARLFELYLVSGMRRNELLYLEWSDIEWEKREVHIRNKPERKFYTKTRYERVIPLSKDIERILGEIGPEESGLIFKGERSGNVLNEDFVCKKFRKYRDEAGINNRLTIHNLRHTFATRRVERGAPLEAISKILGHTTLKMTQRYEHSKAQQYQKDMDRDSLDDIIGKEEGGKKE